MSKLLSRLCAPIGYRVSKYDWDRFGDGSTLQKGRLLLERMRDVVSDPLNVMIERVPQAGFVDANRRVVLHNGNRVAVSGRYSYYGDFSDLLVINRGVHEPLEEYCFQETLRRIRRTAPVMVELGAYWAHYSMWLKSRFPVARCTMVEPIRRNLNAGRNNFRANGFEGSFIQANVSADGFRIDEFMSKGEVEQLDILHSDIQGYESAMLDDAHRTLASHKIDYVFVSTHSDDLHDVVVDKLRGHGYRIEASSSFADHSTSYDGFVLASSPVVSKVLEGLDPWGRHEIAHASVSETLRKLNRMAGRISARVAA